MNNKLLMGSAMLFALLIFTLLLIRIPVIEVKTDQETYFIREKSITLSWIHSVEKEPWFEIYERVDDELVLTETYVKAFGAGVPSDLEVIDKKNGFVHMKVERKMDEVNVVVSENVQTTMIIENEKLELYKMLDSYSEVTFMVKDLYFWNLFGGEFI